LEPELIFLITAPHKTNMMASSNDHSVGVIPKIRGLSTAPMTKHQSEKSSEIKAVDYGSVPWLAKRYAITVLPSIASLRALRLFASAYQGP
jgi:hypothetical protein